MNRRLKVRERQIMYARTRMAGFKKPNGWVKPGFITKLTGWQAEELRQAREQGLIEWEDRKNGRFYNIDSIHERFFINK